MAQRKVEYVRAATWKKLNESRQVSECTDAHRFALARRVCKIAKLQNCKITKKKKLLASSCLLVCLSVCLPAWNNSAPNLRTS
jgi:hypothetical protein